MTKSNDLSMSLEPFKQDACVVAVVELSQATWLVAAAVPGIERQPLKKLEPDAEALLRLLHRWRDESAGKGREISRIAVAYEAGRDGFWLARWLRRHGIDVHVIHPTSIAVSREHRRAKTDRLDTALLMGSGSICVARQRRESDIEPSRDTTIIHFQQCVTGFCPIPRVEETDRATTQARWFRARIEIPRSADQIGSGGRILAFNKATPARPYIARFNVFSLLI